MRGGIRLWAALAWVWLLYTGTQAAEYDGFLVKLDPGPQPYAVETAFPNLREVAPEQGLWQTGDLSDVEQMVERGLLEYAEPNYRVTLDDPVEDPALRGARVLDVSEFGWHWSAMEADYAWEHGITGQGVRVGVIDSGIYADHEDFAGVKIVPGVNYCVSEGDRRRSDTSDTLGHGTFVSGLLAAGINGCGIAGLAPEVELVPLKCFEGKNGSVANVIQAIYGGVDTFHCQVLNLSLGIAQPSPSLRGAIAHAAQEQVILTAAAGNLTAGSHGTNGDPLLYPAAYEECIGVGAVTSALEAASFSYRNASVWVCAPGSGLKGLSLYGGYAVGGGTSYASPLIAAAAVLARSVKPDLTIAQFQALLRDTARDLGASGYDTTYGWGLVNIGQLLAVLRGDTAYQAASRARLMAADGALTFLTAYNEKGKLLYIDYVRDSGGVQTPQVQEAALWKLFSLDPDTFTPLAPAVLLSGETS